MKPKWLPSGDRSEVRFAACLVAIRDDQMPSDEQCVWMWKNIDIAGTFAGVTLPVFGHCWEVVSRVRGERG